MDALSGGAHLLVAVPDLLSPLIAPFEFYFVNNYSPPPFTLPYCSCAA